MPGVKAVSKAPQHEISLEYSVPLIRATEIWSMDPSFTGTGITVAVIDTGIDYTHPDLNVNTTLSKTFVARTKSATDDNGHGSHVAGTIAAIDNTIGVVGVAAGAEVVAVKVLDKRGSGDYSVVIAGVDYVAATAASGDVVNMSLGGPVSDALDAAVLAAANKGIKFALAAGNESQNANNSSPARVNHSNVYTISAMDASDVWAYFSNYANPPVDYCAPGVNINSTWKSGGYSTISGTSMASPHAAGVLMLGNPTSDGNVIGDPDGNADPIIHR
jgi:subtilisin family serine protease